MNSIHDEKAIFEGLARLIAHQFGKDCEVVIHDLTGSYDHTIAIIENGHVTGRKVGDPGSNLGLEVLRGTVVNGDKYGYITHTPDGKILRSSTIYIRNAENEVIGAVCINLDISGLTMVERQIRDLLNLHAEAAGRDRNTDGELFASDVNQLLDALISEALSRIGKPVSAMTRADKIQAVTYLDARGAFLISKAGIRVCKQLGISKFTLYSYLEMAHHNNGDGKTGPVKRVTKPRARAGKPSVKRSGKDRPDTGKRSRP